MAKIQLLVLIAGLGLAPALAAAQEEPDFGRPGWYVGAGGGVGVDFLSEAVDDVSNGEVEIETGGSANVRVGYRIWSWFALEAMYEGIYGTDIKLRGDDLADLNLHSALANMRFIVPVWRTHPYATIGFGAQYGDFDGDSVLNEFDTTRWDFVLRAGVGLDTYVTENWVVNLELTPSVSFARWDNIPSETTDNVTLTFTAGLHYRF